MKLSNKFRFAVIGSLSSTLLGSSALAGLMTPDELGMSAKVMAAPFAISAAGFEKASLSASPEQIARAFLARASTKLGLKSDLSDLKLASIQNAPAGDVVRFEQIINGVSVDSADVVVTVSSGEVLSLINNYSKVESSRFEKAAPVASLSEETALQSAYASLKLTASPRQQTIEQKVSVIDGNVRPVYVISIFAPVDHNYGQEVVVDADSGAILRSRSTVHHGGKTRQDVVTTAVFDPNPTLKSGHIYGSVAGYDDSQNADSEFFKSMMTPISLDNLTLKGGNYILSGPYVQITEMESPTNPNCDVKSTTKSWNYTRSSACFDSVSAYYFIDKTLRYITGTLGFKGAHPLKYTGGIKVDPKGLDGDDNSHYSETMDYLAFGEGGVDDAQDHDVVIHELGHAIHSWLTNGHISQVEGLSEGIGDYWAASYDRQFTKPGDTYRDWVFSYDGHNPFWPGRDVASKGKYPADAQSSDPHESGSLWATVCIEIYDVIGKEKADKAFWSGISMLNASSNQNDAAKAYLAAARKLYPSDKNLINTVLTKFKARGYTVQ